jgi:hypothetical protein
MAWIEKFGKGKHASVLDLEENDLPLKEVTYLRIGSACAQERSGDEAVLKELLEKFVQEINVAFDPDEGKNTVTIKSADDE